MAKKNNTSLYAGIAVAVIVVVAIIIGVVTANKNKSGGDPGQSQGGSSQSVPQYSTIDETVTYGDYDSMEILSKKIRNGEMVIVLNQPGKSFQCPIQNTGDLFDTLSDMNRSSSFSSRVFGLTSISSCRR